MTRLYKLCHDASFLLRLRKQAQSVRINYPYNAGYLRHFKSRCARTELEVWEGLGVQGRAVPSLRGDKVGNSIMREPSLLKPCRCITALQLRTNTAGNRTSLNRARPLPDVSCRKCGVRKVTLANIIRECISKNPAHIKRHHNIVNFVMSSAMRDEAAEVTREPELTLEGVGKLKPDLVIKN